MLNEKIGVFITKKDFIYNLSDFPNNINLVFVTGLFGSGKSTLANELAKKYNAIHLQQDWLTWSKCYSNKESDYFVKKFKEAYPETTRYFEEDLWHGHKDIRKEDKNKYRKLFDEMLVNYALSNKGQLFIIEGASLYMHQYTADLMKDFPVVIKRTSLIRSLKNMSRRDLGKVNIKSVLYLFKRYKKHWTKDRHKLNSYIIGLKKNNNQN